MIRVAHLIPAMFVGGTEEMVLGLCRNGNAARFQYLVASPNESVIAEELRAAGVEVVSGTGAHERAVEWADLVNFHCWDYSPYWMSLARAARKPHVATLHCRTALPVVECLTICTAQHILALQPQPERCVVIGNGTDLARFPPRPRPARDEVVITRVCRVSRCAAYFWEAMARVLARCPQAHLWIVGNDAGSRSHHPRIRFWGVRRDIPEILAQTDIFAYAPFPNHGTRDLVVMEAAAAGVPCVVSNVGCVQESVIPGETGFLVPPGDPRAFAEKVELLVRDAALRERMGAHAADLARREFDLRTVAGRYETVYETVVDAWSAARVP